MYIVSKGGRRVSLKDKDSATGLIYTMTILGCTEAFSTQRIVGNKEDADIYIVDFCGKSANAIGQEDAITILTWMLNLGCSKVCITKAGEESNDN